eukprot:c22183_g1_i1 orf=676-3876(-)
MMKAASLNGGCQCSLPSVARPNFLDSLARAHSASCLIRRKPRSLTSTLVCSDSAQFSWSQYRRSLQVRASAHDDAEDGNADADPPESVRSNDQRGEAEASGASPQLLTSVTSALASGTRRYMLEFQEELKKEAGLDLDAIKRAYAVCLDYIERRWQELTPLLRVSKSKADELVIWARESSDIFKQRVWPQFVSWNRLELWKDVERWDAQRYGAIVIYILVAASCVRALHNIFVKPHRVKQLTNSYMEAVIPDPSPQNVKKLRMAVWRKRLPKGLRMQRYVYGSDGGLHHDLSYIGENPWDESEHEGITFNEVELIDNNPNLTPEQKKDLKDKMSEIADMEREMEEARAKMSWQERLVEWDKMLRLEHLKDRLLEQSSKFVIGVDLDEIKKSLSKEENGQSDSRPPRAFLVSKNWWQYRPKLPYTYFLSKLRRLEVESAVYTSDLRRLYVRMKEGFPAEYTVGIPVDPFLHDLMRSCKVEIDVIGRNEWSYYSRAFIVLAPSVFILLQVKHFSNRAMEMTSEKILDLLKMDREHLILPEDASEKAKSEYKDVIIGDKVWKVLEEIMGYMREPMRYYGKGLFLPRGVLISGPPGTGKTLLARAIARESGLPFVFASGAEFVESSTGDGAEKVFNLFFTARANAPSFIFIDEIDALAGKGVDDDPERKATFDQLITELDGLPENTSVDRFSKRQSVVLICATNRPQELHQSFLRPGRIDREIHIGLPGEQQRIRIFAVHSRNRRLAEDVDFTKLVFRTVGYSGADIRNMINEAGIMAVRRGRSEICQQDFVDVLDKQLFEGMGLSLTDEEQIRLQKKVPLETRRLLAVHEAGHVLLAHLFPRYDCHALTHLLPGGKQSALTLFYPREEMLSKNYTTVGYLKMHIVVAHGGRCAERLVFGDDITDGGQDDLARISRIAREIAISHASPRLGLYPMLWKDKFDPPLPPDEVDLIPKNWDKPGNRIANMTMELSEMFTREVTRYADEAEDEAMRGLSLNRHILDRLASELLERTNINGLEIADMIKSMNPVMLPDYLDPKSFENSSMEQPDDQKKAVRFEELDIWQAPLPMC